jgi:uncharacterized 2Fe-2S/4Fe-4S cluster protein (DUF4445 family)
MHRLKIHTAGKVSVTDVPHGSILLEVLRDRGYDVYSPCGGKGTCGKCKVYVRGDGHVTSCLYPVKSAVEIVLPEPREATILASQYRYSRQMDPDPGVSAGLSRHPVGVAIDVGTTTLVFHFISLSTGSVIETHTALNPQSKFGADVISRINYCISNTGGLSVLQSALINAINFQLARFCRKSDMPAGDIVKICFCGNTTMLHILLGVNPGPLAFVPFTPAFTGEKVLKASELNLDCNPEGELRVLPSLSAYVGADIVAGIASLAPDRTHRNSLFVDLGTNGEIALITPDRIWCCATAAGPAFEGANIEHGMGALEGAIKGYYGHGNFQTIGDSLPMGICGSGLVDLAASLLKTSVIRTDGFMEENFIIVPAEKSGTSEDIHLTPKDVREIQLAKSAIASGIRILVKYAGLSMSEVDALYLAGGFGNYVRTESASEIGLLPYELAGKVIPVGNTSGTGALLSVKSVFFDKIVNELLNSMNFVELSEHEDFVLEFAMNMEFPYIR